MRVRVAEIAAVEHHGSIQQGLRTLAVSFQLRKEAAQKFHMLAIDHFEFGQFRRIPAVMRQVVVAVRNGLSFDLDGDSDEGVECQALVLAWDSAGAELVQATLFKPSLDHHAQQVDLLGDESQEEDIDIDVSAAS